LYVALVIYFVFLSLFIFELENSHVSTEWKIIKWNTTDCLKSKVFLLPWPWPRLDNVDERTWPEDCEDVQYLHIKMDDLTASVSQVRALQTDTQTDTQMLPNSLWLSSTQKYRILCTNRCRRGVGANSAISGMGQRTHKHTRYYQWNTQRSSIHCNSSM